MPLIKPTRGTLLNKSHPLARGLALQLLMNEGTGGKVFDSSGNGNTGDLKADTHFVPGKFGTALDFDGSGDYVDASSSQMLISSGTICAWVNYDNVVTESGSDDYIIARRTTAGDLLYLSASKLSEHYIGIGDVWTSTGVSIVKDQWMFLVLTWDGTNYRWYKNGVERKSNTYSNLTTVGSQIIIGGVSKDDVLLSGYEFDGQIDHVMLFNRALSPSEIALLYREPFCMFERAWRPELTGGQIVNLAGTSTALSSLSTTAKALRKIAGTAVGTSNTTAALSSIRGLLPEMERSWLAEALFNGMSANAFKLGTTLSMGWFWTRVAGCSVLYRGSSMGEIDFAKVLAVSERDASEVSPPSYLSHSNGSTYFYVIRRFNSCGCQERTLAAAVKVSIESSGDLAEPGPNNISSSKVKQVHSNKIRLVWFYCPLEQKSQLVSFNVYYDDRTGQIDYQNPLASIGYKGRKFYSFQSDELDSGRYLFAIRAEGPEGLENSSLAQLKIELNTTSLDVINILSAEAV